MRGQIPADDVKVDEYGASRCTGLAVGTLRNYRATGRGPSYFKVGKSVRYSLKELRDWMDERRVRPSGGDAA